ncbi:hypothetical protein SEA_FLYPOTENUSE_81 [Mycobacterium phage Flypotenuse]|nr:hypothetical protein SEA_FLYPOTENUSE_81 [Mycobacterium phage Flypotenuse]
MSDFLDIRRSIETPQGGVFLHIDLDTVTYTSVTNAINALDDVYRSVRAELARLERRKEPHDQANCLPARKHEEVL